MIKNYKVLALIPARKGSVRISNKNTKLLAGLPLIEYTFRELGNCKYIDRSVLITDDEKIIEMGKKYSVEAPFIEPEDLANGKEPDFTFFTYALQWLRDNEGYIPDIIVQLRPTSPFRTSSDIDRAIEMLVQNPDVDSVRTVTEPEQSPYKMYKISEEGLLFPLLQIDGVSESFNLPQASLPKAYKHVGYVDTMWLKTLTEKKMMTGDKVLPLIIEDGISGINTMKDWEYYEYLINKRNGNE